MPDARAVPIEDLHLAKVPCDYCGETEADVVLTGRDCFCGLPGEFHVVACRRCGLRRTSPQPTGPGLAAAYPEAYSPHRADVTVPPAPAGSLRWVLANYRRYPLGRRSPAAVRWLAWPWAALRLRNRKFVGYLAYEGDGRLLDLGCSIGQYVAEMQAAGWQAEGVDLVPEAIATGRRAGLNLHEGTLPGTDLPRDHYDLVTMWHVIEHLPAPKATLEAICGVLKPGGRLALACPISDSLGARWFGPAWYGLDVPRHLTHFTRATLRRHLEAAGFAIERTQSVRRPTFVRRSYGYLADETGSGLHRWLSRSRMVARLMSHAALAARRTDEILVVARRK